MSINKKVSDFLIIGGGVIGTTLARALSLKYEFFFIVFIIKVS